MIINLFLNFKRFFLLILMKVRLELIQSNHFSVTNDKRLRRRLHATQAKKFIIK